jgi:hypothetical protein
MQRLRILIVGSASGAVVLGGLLAFGRYQPAQPAGEQERKVTEAEVPKAALEALKRLADTARITEFEEEIEHGHTFYEGSWSGPNGNVDALVTASGDLVEIEETIPADKVPSLVRAETEKAAGKGAKVKYEKKTLVMYEVHFKKGDRGQEVILTPDGRRYMEEGADQGRGDQDEDEHEDE